MKKIACGLVVLLVVALASALMAQPKPETTPPPTERLARFMGVIENIDEAAKTIEVKAKKPEPVIFFTDEKTEITVGSNPASFGDLKIALYVMVEYRQEGTKRIAVTITEGAPKSRRR